MTTTTPTGIPVTDCTRCHHQHPVTRSHCAACGTASAFIDPRTGTCLKCTEAGSPCICWTSPRCPEHDGHCCFGPTAPEDCHDEAGRAAANHAYHYSTDAQL